MRILGEGATEAEQSVLSAFPYEPNEAVLHTDESVLPKRRSAWACWNYHIDNTSSTTQPKSTLTYNMNMLQHLNCHKTLNVTLNSDELIDPDQILGRFKYSHPIFTVERNKAQARHAEVIRSHRTSFCGAYWGNGFHEDGVVSAMKVVRAFETDERQTGNSNTSESAHA